MSLIQWGGNLCKGEFGELDWDKVVEGFFDVQLGNMDINMKELEYY